MSDFIGKGKVAVLKTHPDSVLDDIEQLMVLAGVEQALAKEVTTGIKINISWQTWYPACSSTPWQLEGVIRALQKLGYNDLVGVHNDTVVVDTSVAEFNNKHRLSPTSTMCRANISMKNSSNGCVMNPKNPSWCWIRSIRTAFSSPRYWSAKISFTCLP
jgi:hypothetical protein